MSKVKIASTTHKKDPPWFDKTCKNLKRDIKSLGKEIQRNAADAVIREKLYGLKRKLKKIVADNKRFYKNTLIDKMNCSNKNAKEFWKLLDKLGHKQDNIIFSNTNYIGEKVGGILYKNISGPKRQATNSTTKHFNTGPS